MSTRRTNPELLKKVIRSLMQFASAARKRLSDYGIMLAGENHDRYEAAFQDDAPILMSPHNRGEIVVDNDTEFIPGTDPTNPLISVRIADLDKWIIHVIGGYEPYMVDIENNAKKVINDVAYHDHKIYVLYTHILDHGDCCLVVDVFEETQSILRSHTVLSTGKRRHEGRFWFTAVILQGDLYITFAKAVDDTRTSLIIVDQTLVEVVRSTVAIGISKIISNPPTRRKSTHQDVIYCSFLPNTEGACTTCRIVAFSKEPTGLSATSGHVWTHKTLNRSLTYYGADDLRLLHVHKSVLGQGALQFITYGIVRTNKHMQLVRQGPDRIVFSAPLPRVKRASYSIIPLKTHIVVLEKQLSANPVHSMYVFDYTFTSSAEPLRKCKCACHTVSAWEDLLVYVRSTSHPSRPVDAFELIDVMSHATFVPY